MQCFIDVKVNSENTKVLPIVLARNMMMLQHLIIHFSLHYLSSGHLWEVENKVKFQTLCSKSGCCRISEAVALQEVLNIVI